MEISLFLEGNKCEYNEVIVYAVMMFANPLLIVLAMCT